MKGQEFIDFECQYDKNASVESNTKDIPLTKHKYSWVITKKFIFPEDFFIDKKLRHVRQAIKLMHPVEETIWLLYGPDTEGYVLIFNGKKRVYCTTLIDVNSQLDENENYTGRQLKIEDL